MKTTAMLPLQQRWIVWDGVAEGLQVAAEAGAEGDEEVGAVVTAAHVQVMPSAGA